MVDGTVINAGSGTIALLADENITLGQVTTTNTGTTAVTLTSTEGAIVDGGDTGGADVIAGGRLVIDAVTGVGSGGALETTVASVDIDNATSGNIEISETNAITVFKAVQGTAGNIGIAAGGTITVDNAGGNAITVLGTGTVTLDANGAASDLLVNDGILSVNGAITLTADNDVIFQATGDIASTAGAVSVRADADNGGTSSGALTMVDGTVINAGSGTIALLADENITLGQVTTTNTGTTAVTLTSTEGGIVDGGDTGGADVITAGGRLVIDAVTGVGSGNANRDDGRECRH